MQLNDPVLRHLAEVTGRPDMSGTRYDLEGEIGRGGLGVVYAARDRELNRRVAIKCMDAALAGEAPLIARLEHPGIVPVYERGTLPDGREWYAMKLVEGDRLDEYVKSPRGSDQRLRVFRRVCEAVEYAHSCGVLHRDLKPQNVMVGAFGEVYVMDWGVAAVSGTPAFRPPEKDLDERSDVYGLGGLLRFLALKDAGPALSAMIAKATSVDAGARYGSVAELLGDLDRYEAGLAVEAWQEPLWHRARRFSSRNAVLLWLLLAFAVVKAGLYFLRAR